MSRELLTSVALATCNGGLYLAGQLESIASQTRLPDEIVIGDDQSTDATADIVAAFSRRYPNLPVRFTINPERLGTSRNFESIVRRCAGDIILFTDQDDRWFPIRVVHALKAFTAHPRSAYVFADGLLMDGNDRPLPGTLFSSLEFSAREREMYRRGEGIRVLLRRNVVTGATLAVRRAELLRVLPLEPTWHHDYFIALALEVLGGGIVMEEPLIRYRRHAHQQVGLVGRGLGDMLSHSLLVARKQDADWCQQEAKNFRICQQRLMALGLRDLDPVLVSLEKKARFFDARAGMRTNPLQLTPLLWRTWQRGDYRLYSSGWKQVVIDILSSLLSLTGGWHPPRGGH